MQRGTDISDVEIGQDRSEMPLAVINIADGIFLCEKLPKKQFQYSLK